jgi:geranylgeranyl transferase type-2 subunit beta
MKQVRTFPPSLRASRNRSRTTEPQAQKKKGAFGAHPGHDAHILSTLSAIQVLATHDALSRINQPRIIDCPSLLFSLLPLSPHYIILYPDLQRTLLYTVILGLQQPSGVFAGDAFGETDTRFLYCAVCALSLLGALDRLDRERTVSYLSSCRNFDGGFGRIAGSESHAGQGMLFLSPYAFAPSGRPPPPLPGAPLAA